LKIEAISADHTGPVVPSTVSKYW